MSGFLRELGLEPVHLPLIAQEPTGAPPPTSRPSVVLISSAAVLRFVPNLARWIGDAPLIAVGEATAAALEDHGIPVSAVGRKGGAEALLLALRSRPAPDGLLWYVGTESPASPLELALAACPHERWSVYRHRAVEARSFEALLPLDAVTFASPSAVRVFPIKPDGMAIITIGDTTASAATQRGWGVDAVAASPSLKALAEATAQVLGRRSPTENESQA